MGMQCVTCLMQNALEESGGRIRLNGLVQHRMGYLLAVPGTWHRVATSGGPPTHPCASANANTSTFRFIIIFI